MKAIKGKKKLCEWEHMLIESNKLCLGVHYIDNQLTSNEKQIIFKHLKSAAEEITSKRLRIEK